MNNEEYMAADLGSEYLAHHGILGMKWGEKNGPPYPLDAEGKKAIKEQRKAARKEKAEQAKKKAKEHRKKVILNDPEKIVKYRAELTKEEIDEALNKLKSVKEVKNLTSQKQLSRRKRDIAKNPNKLLKNMDQFSNEELDAALKILDYQEKIKQKRLNEFKDPLSYVSELSKFVKDISSIVTNVSNTGSRVNKFFRLLKNKTTKAEEDAKKLTKAVEETVKESKKDDTVSDTSKVSEAAKDTLKSVDDILNMTTILDESFKTYYSMKSPQYSLSSTAPQYSLPSTATPTVKDLEELAKRSTNSMYHSEYLYSSDLGSEYLAHHGILGMRWGEKNGPPYPLDAEGKKAIKEQRKAARKEKAEQSNPKIKEIDDGFFKTLEIKNKDFSIIADPKAVKDKNDFIKASKELPNIDKLLKNSIMSNRVFKSINSDYFNGTISPQDLKFVNSNYSGSNYPIELSYSVNNNLSNGIDFIVVQWDRKHNKISNSKNAIYVEG